MWNSHSIIRMGTILVSPGQEVAVPSSPRFFYPIFYLQKLNFGLFCSTGSGRLHGPHLLSCHKKSHMEIPLLTRLFIRGEKLRNGIFLMILKKISPVTPKSPKPARISHAGGPRQLLSEEFLSFIPILLGQISSFCLCGWQNFAWRNYNLKRF